LVQLHEVSHPSSSPQKGQIKNQDFLNKCYAIDHVLTKKAYSQVKEYQETLKQRNKPFGETPTKQLPDRPETHRQEAWSQQAAEDYENRRVSFAA
jgi:hypothetical protein